MQVCNVKTIFRRSNDPGSHSKRIRYINLDNVHQSIKTLALFLFSAIIISTSIGIIPNLHGDSTITYLSNYLHRYAGDDSWSVMIKAVNQVRSFPDDSIYKALILKDNTKFQYPPTSLLFIDIPQKLTHAPWPALTRVANQLCWLSIPIIGIVFFCILITQASFPFENNISSIINLPNKTFLSGCLVSLIAVAIFYPILKSFNLGQVQTPMTMLAGFALLAWKKGKFGLAGFLLGICCGFKPQWLAIIPWAILRRQWRFLSFFSIISITLILVSILMYGVTQWVDYFSVLSFLSKHGESFYANQSINGLLHRMIFNGTNLTWMPLEFAPFNIWVYILSLVSSFFMLIFATIWGRDYSPKAIDLAIIILTLTMASPIAWEHHYGVILLIYGLVLPTSLLTQPMGKWTIPYLWLSFMLTSQKLDVFSSRFSETNWNFLQSTLFFGATMLLILLYKLSPSKIKNP